MSKSSKSPEKSRLPNPAAWRRGIWRDARLLGRAFGLLLRAKPRLGWGLLGLSLIYASLPVAQLWLTRGLVNALAAGDERRALLLGGVSALATLGLAMVLPVQELVTTLVQQSGVATVERSVIAAGRDYADLVEVERPGFQDDVRLSKDGWDILGQTIGMAGRFYSLTFSLIGVLLSLAVFHPLIPVALLVAGSVNQTFMLRSSRLEFLGMQERTRDARKMSYALETVTEPRSAAEVRVFGLNDLFVDRYRHHADETLAVMQRARLKGFGYRVLGTLGYVVTLGGTFWYIAGRAGDGSLSIGDVALYIYALIQAEVLSRGLLVAIWSTHNILMGLRHMFPFLDAAGPRVVAPGPGAGLPTPTRWRQGISVADVSFTYPQASRAVLDSVSFQIPAGKVVALVGENGAGKTTLVKLLSRMYDPTSGEITLDGEPLRRYDQAGLRARTTVVYQDAARFAFTLADNLALADPAFSWATPDGTRAQARELGDRIGLDWVADKLPRGYGQMLTHTFEGGVELSGGQWQLVAFGRGLMRDDAALAILDEPSSALDPERERDQIDHLKAFARRHRRGVLLISHRLSTVRWADEIVVLDGGRAVERGSHDTLLARGGAYADLFTMQASRYRDDADLSDAASDTAP